MSRTIKVRKADMLTASLIAAKALGRVRNDADISAIMRDVMMAAIEVDLRDDIAEALMLARAPLSETEKTPAARPSGEETHTDGR